MDYEAARERVKRKIEERCLLRDLDIPGRGGERHSWILYMRPGLFDPKFMEDVGLMFLHRCREEIGNLDFQICGLETGAVPLIVGLPMVAAREGVEINAFSVRKEPKAYGLMNSIEGNPNGKRALLVDDIANSTYSLRKCLDIVQREGVEFSGWVFSIIRRRFPHHDPNVHMPADTKYIYLFDIAEWGLG